MALSVPELAARLGVAESRARFLVSSGRIPGQRVGSHWVIEESEAAAYRPPAAGRPLKEPNAWLFVEALRDGHDREWSGREAMNAVERHRLSARVAKFKASDAPLDLALSLLARRADEMKFSADPADLEALKEDPRLRPSGVSHPDAGLLAGSEIEAYLRRRDLDAVIKDYLLIPAIGRRANVVLHAADEVPDEIPALVAAVDLAERGGAREEEAARKLVMSARGH